MDARSVTLTVDGEVDRPLVLTWDQVREMPLEERTLRVDCLGAGLRSTSTVRGLPLMDLFEMAGVRGSATCAVFHCADGYCESASLAELLLQDAFLAYPLDGGTDELDRLPRLAVPGKYGYKFAKWVERVSLVAGEPGHWIHALPPMQSPQGSGRAFPLAPPCCQLYVWARKRLWRAGTSG